MASNCFPGYKNRFQIKCSTGMIRSRKCKTHSLTSYYKATETHHSKCRVFHELISKRNFQFYLFLVSFLGKFDTYRYFIK